MTERVLAPNTSAFSQTTLATETLIGGERQLEQPQK
jgi:hypothetical protein